MQLLHFVLKGNLKKVVSKDEECDDMFQWSDDVNRLLLGLYQIGDCKILFFVLISIPLSKHKKGRLPGLLFHLKTANRGSIH